MLTYRCKSVKSIRSSFEIGRDRAGVDKYSLRGFRTGTMSHWQTLGVIRTATMIASGHKPNGVHEINYMNLSDEKLIAAFARAGLNGLSCLSQICPKR